jgi:hypothetical protein
MKVKDAASTDEANGVKPAEASSPKFSGTRGTWPGCSTNIR